MATVQRTMPNRPLDGILKRVRTLAEVQTGRAQTDQELLARFIEQNDEAAFTVLIERHGPMVLGVCMRALRNIHDAEDACQATFLILARKAVSIRKSESLSSWLHGIARRIAANVKRAQIRHKAREQRVALPIDHASSLPHWHDVQAILDEEVEELPQRYRGPLLLCYWEGKTRDEAASQLSMTAGKIHGLLERGRELLRDRLTKRGLTLSAALCSSLLVAGTTNAALDPSLVVASTKAALLLASGNLLTPGLVSTHVITLTREVLQTMFLTKLKIATASILCAGLVMALIGGSLASSGLAQDKTKVKVVEQLVKPEPDEAFIRRMSKDLRNTEPSPAEIHFFVFNKDAGKRQKLIDLFIQERQLKQNAAAQRDIELTYTPLLGQNNGHLQLHAYRAKPSEKSKLDESGPLVQLRRRLEAELQRIQFDLQKLRADEDKKRAAKLAAADQSIQKGVTVLQSNYVGKLIELAREKKEVSGITQNYLEALMTYVKANPKAGDAPDTMLQIELVYRALGKAVEANAWREKLNKEYPNSPAAKTKQTSLNLTPQRSIDEQIMRVYLGVDDLILLESKLPAKK